MSEPKKRIHLHAALRVTKIDGWIKGSEFAVLHLTNDTLALHFHDPVDLRQMAAVAVDLARQLENAAASDTEPTPAGTR